LAGDLPVAVTISNQRQNIELSAREFDLLRLLMMHPNQVLARAGRYQVLEGPDEFDRFEQLEQAAYG